MKRFSELTLKVYLPGMVCIFLFYFTVNIAYVVPDSFLQEHQRAPFYGFFKFQAPLLEAGFMQITLFTVFYWCKLCQRLSDNEDRLVVQGTMVARYWTREGSSSFFSLLLLALPAVEPLLLFTILLAGLNKVDFYHMLYIPLFVGYLIFPKGESGAKHKCISTLLVVWSFSFLLAK